MRRRAAALLLASTLAVGLTACGGGENVSDVDTLSTPDLTVPNGSSPITSGTTGTTGTTGSTGTTTTTTGTTSTPSGGTPPTPAPNTGGTGAPGEDTQGNDQAPPAGSPASKFEQFCKENPGAC